MKNIVVIAHDIRSCHNVGSLFRTCEGLGVKKLYLTGYTPYPKIKNDERLPHIQEKISKKINKASLGAENSQSWEQNTGILSLIAVLKENGYTIIALEQDKNAIKLPDYQAPEKTAIILGREVEGIESKILKMTDSILEIPMFGKKESYNVVQATAIALYQLTFY